MTKDECRNISLGVHIRLARGDIVEVTSVDQQRETITFQYLEHPQTSPITPPVRRFVLSGSPKTRLPFSAEVAQQIAEEVREIGKTPTIVKCSWVELLTATRI